MDKIAFAKLFDEILMEAEASAGVSNVKRRSVDFQGFGLEGSPLTTTEALDQLWLGAGRFYKIIDVGLRQVADNDALFFVRPSAHPPESWAETLDPAGRGPFKRIDFSSAVDRRS